MYDDEVTLKVGDRAIRNWESYSFNSDFLTPTDGFTFTIGDEDLSIANVPDLIVGAEIKLFLGNKQQATGYIDSVERTASRESGIQWTIAGRDIIAPLVDGGIDYKAEYKDGMALSDILDDVIGRFGMSFTYASDDTANIQTKSGVAIRGKRGKVLKSVKSVTNIKPTFNEGAWEFISRTLQRHGLWAWPSADGAYLVVGKPNFDASDTYGALERLFTGQNTILEGTAKIDLTDQPSAIVACGYTHGGEFLRSQTKAFIINPFVGVVGQTADAMRAKFKADFPGIEEIKSGWEGTYPTIFLRRPKVMYLQDHNSKDQEHIRAYALREMSLKNRHMVTARYTVAGHLSPTGAPWCVNTCVNVKDEVGGINEPMWIMGRTFTKSRSAGTLTTLELVRRGTVSF